MIDVQKVKEYLEAQIDRMEDDYRGSHDPYIKGKISAYSLTLILIKNNEKESQCQNS